MKEWALWLYHMILLYLRRLPSGNSPNIMDILVDIQLISRRPMMEELRKSASVFPFLEDCQKP